ncbi:sigma factor-like helix-turn-helix DNA-binding protein [Streptomyces sp. P1-3]|uniref:sigma factor-like helix-turn-helix DNA-binding protein n=1 Tax=Streptomyces sp. P1-3 TaxID=3421658 RepID=UPI003D36FADD
MRQRRAERERLRAREFEKFVAGAGGRLLHAAALLTAEPPERCPAAERLLVGALARTYADWDRLRGEDPYDRARQELTARFAWSAWRYRRPRPEPVPVAVSGGLLERLTPQERLVLVLRLYEGIAEEQAAALLGLPVERVRAICTRAVAVMRAARRAAALPSRSPSRSRSPEAAS